MDIGVQRTNSLWFRKQRDNTKVSKRSCRRRILASPCSGVVEEIYWVGGEPLMYDIHWRAMDRLAEDNNLHKVHLRYNSNL